MKTLKKAIAERLTERDEKPCLKCSDAFEIAQICEVDLAEVARICHKEGFKIVQCQLGCFR